MDKSRDKRKTKLLRQIKELRHSFGEQIAVKKIFTLLQLSKATYLKPSELLTYHDILCFLRAYPDNPKILAQVEKELKSFAHRVEQYKEFSRDRKAKRLTDSGIVNTTTIHAFSFELTRQLLEWYPKKLEFAREYIDNLEKILDLLPLLISWQENDSLDNDDDFDFNLWLNTARGKKSPSELHAIVNLIAASRLPKEIQRHFFDSFDLQLAWNLIDSPASRTLRRIPSGRRYYQKESLRGRTSDLRSELTRPASPLHKLSQNQGKEYIRAANEILAVRNRELFPITFANPAEVYVNEPGRGLSIIIFGARPEIRLPLESNFGALLVRNGMPVGYGVAATLFDRVEIAINIFPAFRTGESPFAIEQFFRVFYHHFGSRVFLARSAQMGHHEEEALHSGAFWFYNKLGFRAIDRRVRKLAEREYDKIKRRSKYRTPIRQMKRLARSDVFFHVDPNGISSWQELSIVNLGYLVTQYFADRFDGDRRRGIAQSVSKIASILKIHDLNRWPRNAKIALERMSPLIANIPGLATWSRSEKDGLIHIIRRKGGLRERSFVLYSNRHRKFKAALEQMAHEYTLNKSEE